MANLFALALPFIILSKVIMWQSILTWRIYKFSGLTVLWMVAATIGTLTKVLRGPESINNYLIFKGVFWHTWMEKSLYQVYPAEYFDNNHYGPVFSLIIAPFALLPDVWGCTLWGLINAGILLYAIDQLPLNTLQKSGMIAIGLLEMITSIQNVQFNPMLTSWVLLAYVWTIQGKDHWATLLIAAGFLVKIYGIIGLVAWFFSKRRWVFAASFLGWIVLLFVLPMLISSPTFVWESYGEWLAKLAYKNEKNRNAVANAFMQDISVPGMIRRISGRQFWDGWILLPAAAVYAAALFSRWKSWGNAIFQQSFVAFLLIGVVLFSTSSESATYVIAVTGVAWWFVLDPQPRPKWQIGLLVFVLVLTSLSPTDLFPAVIRENLIKPYSLKALPCFLIWLVMAWRFLFSKKALEFAERNKPEKLG